MLLSEGVKLKGCPAEIPDCSRDGLPGFFKELGFKVGAEIGVFTGNYTEVLAKSGLKIYGVDPWKYYEDYGESENEEQILRRYRRARQRMRHYPNVELIRKPSVEASKDFENGSIDFVYIDGNHQFRYIADDLFEWSKKVKKGGIISGHDYAYFKSHSPCGGCQVHEVVDAWMRAYRIQNFWILGRRKKIGNEVRDDFRSWMFFNE